jgi:hypothetical protein
MDVAAHVPDRAGAMPSARARPVAPLIVPTRTVATPTDVAAPATDIARPGVHAQIPITCVKLWKTTAQPAIPTAAETAPVVSTRTNATSASVADPKVDPTAPTGVRGWP